MLLSIRHETLYRYTAPLSYTIQQLRLSPRAEAHQRSMSWHIHTSGHRNSFVDAFGNASHMLTVTLPHSEVRIVVKGVVEVTSPDRGRLIEKDVLSPLIFTVPTRLADPTDLIKDFAAQHLPAHATTSDLLGLAESICKAVIYQGGATAVTSTASDALMLGQGVCQDHAHLFLACCHAHGIPARYVSGYIDPGSTAHAESHAWVDVWTDQSDFCGWVSIDVTHARFMNDSYCRLAIGRDYESAAPVRGVRHGGGIESLSVKVEVVTDTKRADDESTL
jgi:transglutaminase-like putative cysteine protease